MLELAPVLDPAAARASYIAARQRLMHGPAPAPRVSNVRRIELATRVPKRLPGAEAAAARAATQLSPAVRARYAMREVADRHGVTVEDIRSARRSPKGPVHDARIDCVLRLYGLGFSWRQMSKLMCRTDMACMLAWQRHMGDLIG